MERTYIIDFDSTFITCETLEELSRICLHRDGKTVREIEAITRMGMEGTIVFEESLKLRLDILKPNRRQIRALQGKLKASVSPSIVRNREFFRKNADSIYMVSGGFREFILPVVTPYGIREDHIFANDFVYSPTGDVAGFRKDNPLARSGGKARAVADLRLDGTVIAVGDGWSDYEIKIFGAADLFFAYTETCLREPVVRHADRIVSSFDELLEWIDTGP